MAYHIDNGIHFVMRAKDLFLSGKTQLIRELNKNCMQIFRYKGEQYVFRRAVLILDNGTIETLITTLPATFTMEDLKHLYSKRWGIESKYYYLKHRLQIENFSGYHEISVLQDFYATIFLNNIAAFIAFDSEMDIKQTSKYYYKINMNLLIGRMKNRLIKSILNGGEYIVHFYKRIREKLSLCLVPVRPGRSFPRSEGWKRLKLPPSLKKSI